MVGFDEIGMCALGFWKTSFQFLVLCSQSISNYVQK